MDTRLSNPFNYTGSKFRYLGDLFEILPDEENLKVFDMFYGSGDLSTHLPTSWEISGYDTNRQLIEMHKAIQDGILTVSKVKELIGKADLSKTNEREYYNFRAAYNWTKDPSMLYTLICHSNSNRLRFNSKEEFNLPFGKRTFNTSMQAKLEAYIQRLKERDVFLYNKSYSEIRSDYFDLLLIDPPYLNTKATYNENGGWTEEDEVRLHAKVRMAALKGKKFVYFGQMISNGVVNPYLKSFSEGFNVKILKDTTKHCSANKKNKGGTLEVMIWNW